MAFFEQQPVVDLAEDLIRKLFRDDDRPTTKPPESKCKRYRASLTREIDGVTVRGQRAVDLVSIPRGLGFQPSMDVGKCHAFSAAMTS